MGVDSSHVILCDSLMPRPLVSPPCGFHTSHEHLLDQKICGQAGPVPIWAPHYVISILELMVDLGMLNRQLCQSLRVDVKRFGVEIVACTVTGNIHLNFFSISVFSCITFKKWLLEMNVFQCLDFPWLLLCYYMGQKKQKCQVSLLLQFVVGLSIKWLV